MVTGEWRGLRADDVIGRAGLAEGQSALTGRGRGDANKWMQVVRMAGERWRCTLIKRVHQSCRMDKQVERVDCLRRPCSSQHHCHPSSTSRSWASPHVVAEWTDRLAHGARQLVCADGALMQQQAAAILSAVSAVSAVSAD